MSLRPRTSVAVQRADLLITAPVAEPITVGELREHLKLAPGQEERFLQAMIIVAREALERITGLALLTQTWRMTLDDWPRQSDRWWDGVVQMAISELYSGGGPRWVEISRYPLRSIESVKTFDSEGNVTNVSVTDNFDVDNTSIRGRMILKDGKSWPIALRTHGAIEIEYKAGYGDYWNSIPWGVRQAVMQMAAYFYAHRGDCNGDNAFRKSGAAGLISNHSRARL